MTRHARCLWCPRACQVPFLTTCSDDSKPYMILKGADKGYKNHVGFAIIRASGEEQEPSMFSTSRASRVMHVS